MTKINIKKKNRMDFVDSYQKKLVIGLKKSCLTSTPEAMEDPTDKTNKKDNAKLKKRKFVWEKVTLKVEGSK